MKIDLHMHSYYSDGAFSPAELMQKCGEKGLEIVSLTDHESVLGVLEAAEAGEKLGIRVIPGIEFTSGFQGNEHHILGYFIDCKSRCLEEFLAVWRETKIAQISKMIEKLKQLGFETSLEQVKALAKGSLDRYHVSLALFRNLNKSAAEAAKQKEFFRKFLLEKSVGGDGLAFVERDKPDVQSVIDVIHNSGGLAFWAHPAWKIKDLSVIKELAPIFKKMGLDGIEGFYPHYDQARVLLFHQLSQELLIHESAGSDFHREDGSVRQIGNFQTFGIEINFPIQKKQG